jgi:hypothetical protein
MRELHGVWIPENGTSPNIKALALLFDRLHVLDLDMLEYMAPRNQQFSPMCATDIAFLRNAGFSKSAGSLSASTIDSNHLAHTSTI